MSQIYVSRVARNVLFVYGPFESVQAAQVASMLSRPVDAYNRDSDPKVYANAGVCGYDDAELAAYVANPEMAEGYSGFKHRPAKALRPHASWREHGLEFARTYVERFTK
jgi:hypothetical protein